MASLPGVSDAQRAVLDVPHRLAEVRLRDKRREANHER